MQVATDAYGVTATFGLHNKPVSSLWNFSAVPEVRVTAKALLPSTSVIAFTLGAGLSFTTFVNTVPVRPGVTVNRFALVRRLAADPTGLFNARAWDGLARKAMLRILTEDKAMVEGLRPDMLAREVSVRADLPQTAFRKLRQARRRGGAGGRGGGGGLAVLARWPNTLAPTQHPPFPKLTHFHQEYIDMGYGVAPDAGGGCSGGSGHDL